MRKLSLLILLVLIISTNAWGRAAKTTYPVVFAHGLAGFDDILVMITGAMIMEHL